MKLREFVSGTFTDIAMGIKDAQEVAKREGYLVSCPHMPGGKGGDNLEEVKFDVCVATKGDVNGEVSGDILVFDGSIDGSYEKKDVSHVSFSVFVRWPRQTKTPTQA